MDLQKITIENFKCFRSKTEIDFGKLTLLTGANSSGKSSIIYSVDKKTLVFFRSVFNRYRHQEKFFEDFCIFFNFQLFFWDCVDNLLETHRFFVNAAMKL